MIKNIDGNNTTINCDYSLEAIMNKIKGVS